LFDRNQERKLFVFAHLPRQKEVDIFFFLDEQLKFKSKCENAIFLLNLNLRNPTNDEPKDLMSQPLPMRDWSIDLNGIMNVIDDFL
jgi:hypothetical protein